MTVRGAAVLAAAALVFAACARSERAGRAAQAEETAAGRRLVAVPVAQGLRQPLYLTSPPGDPRLFVVEQPGTIRIIERGRLLETPFLDITDRVRGGGEQGLLSVAFPPDYARSGVFYVDYTNLDGDTRIERYRVTRDPNRADPSSGRALLGIEQPYANHNGGLVLFGPDGMLWIGMGDGGAGGDPHNNGQKTTTLLGKLLRIDVSRGSPYAIPRDNPYATGGGRPEIWAIGLRNPWRFSFDRATGLLYVADVGQNRWEEVDVAPATRAGLNYGWRLMEGDHRFNFSAGSTRRLVRPAYEYGHDDGCSITGGYVYRGKAIPFLRGHYLFSDYCSGFLRSFRYANGRATDVRRWAVGEIGNVTSFGEDADGEVYVIAQDGRVFRLAAR